MKRMIKTFRVLFSGRLIGATGRISTFMEYVKAENKDAALRQICGKYQDVQRPQVTVYKPDTTSTYDGSYNL